MAKETGVTRTTTGARGRAGEARRRTQRARLNILLVEDSPFNRAITTAFLRGMPYRVESAENGAVALKKFTGGRYDLVLMDRQMPVMDGLAATRAIRKWERAKARPPVPIIALTASTLKEDREKYEAAGCTACLAKPLKQEALLQAIGRHVPGAPGKANDARRGRIVVPANPRLADLIPGFLRNRRRDVALILEALDRGDFETVERLGHGMRGAGSSYGFPPITDIGAALERSAESADAEASRKWAGELATYLELVEVVFE
jgi:CheY-like chemotaxis protein